MDDNIHGDSTDEDEDANKEVANTSIPSSKYPFITIRRHMICRPDPAIARSSPHLNKHIYLKSSSSSSHQVNPSKPAILDHLFSMDKCPLQSLGHNTFIQEELIYVHVHAPPVPLKSRSLQVQILQALNMLTGLSDVFAEHLGCVKVDIADVKRVIVPLAESSNPSPSPTPPSNPPLPPPLLSNPPSHASSILESTTYPIFIHLNSCLKAYNYYPRNYSY